MDNTYRWGILGTGNIAHQFAQGMKDAAGSELVAVASRTMDKAKNFTETFKPHFHQISSYEGYQSLLNDPNVDLIYISLPNHMHHEWSIKSLQAGKHVLCEKPLASNIHEAIEMYDCAKSNGKQLMEAYMYLCHPQTIMAKQAVLQGNIGQLRMIKASFSFCSRALENNIRSFADYAGGALMDVGGYCVSLSRYITDEEPIGLSAHGQLNEYGVDLISAGSLKFPSGCIASFACGMLAQTDNTAYICGDEGYLAIPVPWKPTPLNAGYQLHTMTAPKQDIIKGKGTTQPTQKHVNIDVTQNVFTIEIEAFTHAIDQEKELPVTPAFTLGNMKTLDSLRASIGLQF